MASCTASAMASCPGRCVPPMPATAALSRVSISGSSARTLARYRLPASEAPAYIRWRVTPRGTVACSARDVSGGELRPRDGHEDHPVHRERQQSVLHARPVDRRPEQAVPRQPEVSWQVGVDRRQLRYLVSDLAADDDHQQSRYRPDRML